MRKIQFNEQTIQAIRDFISSGHTISETCNRFTLKEDTLRRVMYENNIKPYHKEKQRNLRKVSSDDIDLICSLYVNTNARMNDICKEVKLANYIVQDILDENFSEDYRNNRKSRIYRESKLYDKNPMKNMFKDKSPNWKGGIVDDGNGYLMIKKPEWYTGRKGSDMVFYHSVIFCEAIGLTEIPKGFCIHHIDRNPKNNDINNLCLITISGHAKLHSIERKMCKAQRLSTTE